MLKQNKLVTIVETSLHIKISMFLLFILLISLCVLTHSASVPSRPYGHLLYGSPSSQISIELFGDYICPDTREAWFTDMKEVMSFFTEDEISIRFHTFPLPYHSSSFKASKVMVAAAYVVSDEATLFSLHETMLRNSTEVFGNTEMSRVALDDIQEHMFSFLESEGYSAVVPAIRQQYYEDDNEDYSRNQWKAGCELGVSGTPTFRVNGVSYMAFMDWITFLEGLLAA
eukprot:gnl/Dysnectes_brevis/7699_a13180_356.p1 GENE.gnl/Dysnectes_brevis/7699_a13180_356~~gnl/Dysnectes_brevis/7699_a13180_356.p1  ORF type:complete len:228 (+),score=28.03 gnl/Dysnectes_brevis/7699_a13180_356:90-773(+)